ncbi:MAG: hypothetical protein SFV18_19555 [Bryobacteraceae bacterium]|jgi:hypothetical protein|nr:hypothetical protein [Bryobacteraceae bacterium]
MGRLAKKKRNAAAIVEDLRTMVDTARGQLTKAGAGELKVSVADFIRLLQLYREVEADEPKEIVVRWVESPASRGK